MVLTRTAANNGAAVTVTAAATISKTKAAVRAAKKAKDAERAQMEMMKKSCVVAQRKREEAAASAYIGTMKYLGEMYSTHPVAFKQNIGIIYSCILSLTSSFRLGCTCSWSFLTMIKKHARQFIDDKKSRMSLRSIIHSHTLTITKCMVLATQQQLHHISCQI